MGKQVQQAYELKRKGTVLALPSTVVADASGGAGDSVDDGEAVAATASASATAVSPPEQKRRRHQCDVDNTPSPDCADGVSPASSPKQPPPADQKGEVLAHDDKGDSQDGALKGDLSNDFPPPRT